MPKTTEVMNEWRHFCFGSGTQVVQFMGDKDMPYYYVHAGSNGMPYEHFRHKVCDELAAYLNGGPEPEWLPLLYRDPAAPSRQVRTDEPTNIHITATGPMCLPADDNGKLQWQERTEDEPIRTLLIDKLLTD